MTKSRGIRKPRIDKINVLINREKAALTKGATAMMGDKPAPTAAPEPAAVPHSREIINAAQALILQALRDAAATGLSCPELVTACDLSRTVIVPQLADLRERGLVYEQCPKTGQKPIKWGASMLGRRTLADYLRLVRAATERTMATPAPTYNTRGTTYVPPVGVYYRNDGRHLRIEQQGVRH